MAFLPATQVLEGFHSSDIYLICQQEPSK